jgi:hypothetical protein
MNGGAISVTAISRTGSPVLRSNVVITSPITAPTSNPPIPITMKSTVVAAGENAIAPTATAPAARYKRQRRRVVDQALPLEDRHYPARDAEPPEDGGRRDRIRWRDDRTERQRRSEAHRRDDRLRDETDGHRSEQHEADREQKDGPGVRPEVADRGEIGGREEDRRQEQREHQIGLQLDVGQVREEPQQHARDEQEDRLRDGHPPREVADADRRREQQQDELDGVEGRGRLHVRRSACGAGAG